MRQPTIAILGASANRRKYGNRAVRAYVQRGYDVYPIHPNAQTIEGLRVYRTIAEVPNKPLDRISVYLPPEIGAVVLGGIHPDDAREIWLNPGAESDEVLTKAKSLGLPVIVGCSIVDVGVNPHGLD